MTGAMMEATWRHAGNRGPVPGRKAGSNQAAPMSRPKPIACLGFAARCSPFSWSSPVFSVFGAAVLAGWGAIPTGIDPHVVPCAQRTFIPHVNSLSVRHP